MDTHAATGKQHIIVRCSILSERTLKDIKFDPKQPQFLEWLTTEKTFVESDSLGISKTTTIGYITHLHPQLTNHGNLKQLLQNAREDIALDLDLAVELDPSLKMQQTESMTNGDVFTPEAPPFEVYTTKISHGCGEKEKVTTKVIGIKCSNNYSCLLKEFFLQLALPASYKNRLGSSSQQGQSTSLEQQNMDK